MRKHYIAVVHKEPDSDFRAHFADFPGIVTTAAQFFTGVSSALRMRTQISISARKLMCCVNGNTGFNRAEIKNNYAADV